MSATSTEPPLGVEGWLGQIFTPTTRTPKGEWQDYSRGHERETKRWQREDPQHRRIVHWITRAILVDATRPTLTVRVEPGDNDALFATVEHKTARVVVYEHQSDDDGLVLIVDVFTDDEPDRSLRVYLNDGPLFKEEK